jgi:hypothetical protein
MDCSIILFQDSKYIVRDIPMTLPSLKQFQEGETSAPLKEFVLLFCQGSIWSRPHSKETWQTNTKKPMECGR